MADMQPNPYEAPTTVERIEAPAKTSLLPCAHCGTACNPAIIESDSWGFREFECDKCRNFTTLPLPGFALFAYWIALLGSLVIGIYVVAVREMPLLPLVGILPGYALYRDWKVRRRNAQITQ